MNTANHLADASRSPPAPETRVDLHLHTTWSDGLYTPAQLVELARRSGLAAIAITDHDTVAGIAEARAAAPAGPEIVPGVEITCLWRGRGLHLLGYFFREEDPALIECLQRLRTQRLGRFQEMAQRLRRQGLAVPEEEVAALVNSGTVGRRHLAALLVKGGQVRSEHEAFRRYLNDRGRATISVGLPLPQAVAAVRAAGGVVALAHPSYDCNRDRLAELVQQGLQAVEVEFPACSPRRSRQLRLWAAELGLAVSGGSDCHGPDPWQQAIGSCGVTIREMEALRQRAASVGERPALAGWSSDLPAG
jgi:predicted metal-dependent phosphoesterase TrpH